MIENGASIEPSSVTGSTPLHDAAFHGRLQIARLLIDRCANTDGIDKRSLDYLKEFGEQGFANVEEPKVEGWDLHRAVKENRVDIARALIARGDDIEAKDNEFGKTGLHFAADNNSLDVARLLLECGADIESKSDWPPGFTPLSVAAVRFQIDAVRAGKEQITSTNEE